MCGKHKVYVHEAAGKSQVNSHVPLQRFGSGGGQSNANV